MLTAVKQHASAIPYSYGSEKERCSSLEIAEARLGKDHPSVAATLTNLGSVLSDARTQWINTFWDPNIDEAAQAYPWKLYEDRYHRELWHHRPEQENTRGRSKLRSETSSCAFSTFWTNCHKTSAAPQTTRANPCVLDTGVRTPQRRVGLS